MRGREASPAFPPLAAFQDAFSAALNDTTDGVGPLAGLTAQRGFAVYRNTVMRGCIDSLQANFPAVLRLVGEAWFRAAAAEFVRAYPPRTASLVEYDERFAAFLATFEPAAGLPYLADVARLDTFWTQAHLSADQACVAAVRVAAIEPQALAHCVLHPHVSARWRAFDGPIFSIWRSNRDAAPADLAELEWRSEAALVVRPLETVETLELTAATCAFLDVCGQGMSLADAGSAALGVDADADLAAMLERLLRTGAFGRLDSPPTYHQERQ